MSFGNEREFIDFLQAKEKGGRGIKTRIMHKVKQGDWGYGATVITDREYPMKNSSKEGRK